MKKNCFVIMLSFILISVNVSAEELNKWAIETSDWSSYQGSQKIRIAVIDTGIRRNVFEDTNIEEGVNFALEKQDTDDKIGHGTAVASIISGSYNNKLLGVAPNVTIIPFIYYTENLKEIINGDTLAIAKAIYSAIDDYNCDIINISTEAINDSVKLLEAVEYAEDSGVVITASVGNGNLTHTDEMFYPAGYETVIGVGSLREGDLVSVFSMRNKSVMLLAPGEDISVLSVDVYNPINKTSGTSYASSFVAGTVALILSEN